MSGLTDGIARLHCRVHFVNFPLVADGVLDVTRPELLVYEPLLNGRMRLLARLL